MRRLLLTLALGCLVATSAFASSSDMIGQPTQPVGVRSQIPALTSWVAAGPALTDIWVTGLGWHDAIFWVSGSDFDGNASNGSGDNGIYFYDETGGYIGGFPQPTQDTWGWRDSGYTGTHLIYGASSPHAGKIFYVNCGTLAVEHTVTGCPLSTCRAIAVELAGGGVVQYKVSDFSSNIYTMLWTVGPSNASQLNSCAAPATGPYGFAYDSSGPSIWMSTASSTGELYQLDPVTCSVQNLYDMNPEVQTFGGACMAETSHGCNLWTVCQCSPTDMVFGWATGGANPYACGGATAVEPATWGQIKANYND